MLDQPKLDRGLSFFERRLRRVLTGSRFAVLRRGRHERLALHRLALLQAAQRSKRAKAPIELIYGGRFLDSAIPAIVTRERKGIIGSSQSRVYYTPFTDKRRGSPLAHKLNQEQPKAA